MNQHPNQFEYLGRWVDTKNFRGFVYSKNEQKLARDYQEFTDLIGSGLWFPSREIALKAANSIPLKAKNDEKPLKTDFKSRKNPFRQMSNQGK